MKKKVLFLCIGNSCRSQMAEGFARRYGSDILECESAGLAPASIVQPMTKKVMEAKNINIDEQYPKGLDTISLQELDLVVNMSGTRLPPHLTLAVREWTIEDPIGRPEDLYIEVRDQIEMLVMHLILQLRNDLRKRQGIKPTARKVLSGAGSRSK